VRPFAMTSSKNLVGFLKRTAVRALPIEMLAPAAKVPSILSSAIRFPPSSTTAITPVELVFLASAIAAAMAFLAPSSVRVFFAPTAWPRAAMGAAPIRSSAASAFFIAFMSSSSNLGSTDRPRVWFLFPAASPAVLEARARIGAKLDQRTLMDIPGYLIREELARDGAFVFYRGEEPGG